jgi:4-hydroxy-tetrahydrodipicolinate reductase
MALQIALVGAKGRTGSAISAAAAQHDVVIAFPLGRHGDLGDAIRRADVVMDFSSHETTTHVINLCVEHRKPLVIGTTGHAPDLQARLRSEAAHTAVVWTGNYSIGVNLLFALVQRTSAALGADFDAEVIEIHHRFKKDAPSGTAARLLQVILDERKLPAESLRHGRSGIKEGRSSSEVGVHAVRGGDVIGDHTVIFAALGERVELTHRASDRSIFAHGALRAAHWIRSQDKGLYDMQDVLGLR